MSKPTTERGPFAVRYIFAMDISTYLSNHREVAETLNLIQEDAAAQIPVGDDDQILLVASSINNFVRDFPRANQGKFGISWTSDETASELAIWRPYIGGSVTICLANQVLFKIAPNLLYLAALLGKNCHELHVAFFYYKYDIYQTVTPPSIEDFFYAMAKAGFWRTGLRKIQVNDSHMCAVGDGAFDLEGRTYPEELEEIHVTWPTGGPYESSTIYRVASRSPVLKILSTGGRTGSSKQTLTKDALECLCHILSRVNTLLQAPYKSLPCEEICDLPDHEFAKVLQAVTNGHPFQPALPKPPRFACARERERHLHNHRYHLLKFCLEMNRYRDFFAGGNRHPKSVAPYVLERCQRERSGVCSKAGFVPSLVFSLLRGNVSNWINK